jgi:hypothetical protein
MNPLRDENAPQSILPEPKPQLTAKAWIDLTKVSKQEGAAGSDA